MHLLLIAGHGAGDSGACGCGFREADLTREVVTALKSALSKHIAVDVFDMEKDMYQYLKSSSFNFRPYDYVVEVHFNAAAQDPAGNGKTTGTEMLVHTTEQAVSVEELILKNIAALGFQSRGVKRRSNLQNMNLCKKQGVSYALLEVCFIDDADDMRLYSQNQGAVVSAIASGILDGFGIAPAAPLESANDITWELNHSHFPITETDKFVRALDEAKQKNSPLYWGYYKLVNQ